MKNNRARFSNAVNPKCASVGGEPLNHFLAGEGEGYLHKKYKVLTLFKTLKLVHIFKRYY